MGAISFRVRGNKWRERGMPFRNVNLLKTKISLLAGMCWQQGTPPHRHYIQEVNILIKMLLDKDNFSNKFT